MPSFEKIHPADQLSKRERVELTLALQPVDRVAVHEQLSYNPRVLSAVLKRPMQGYAYTQREVCEAIRLTLDMCFPPVAPQGTDEVTTEDGFVYKLDNWTSWRVSRPFSDERGARDWLAARLRRLERAPWDPDAQRIAEHGQWDELQRQIGETVLLPYTQTGFCDVYDRMGLELFSYFVDEWPELLSEYLECSTQREERRIRAVADQRRIPAILIAEDFATKQGPIFSPEFLEKYHFPYVARITRCWHEHGIKVIYHSDGNYQKVIDRLLKTGVDGFYCLEPACGMDIAALARRYPKTVWAGGLDGVDLMERGTPEAVRQAARRQIEDTDALRRGGIFLATSSEINPGIPPENYLAMIEAAGLERSQD